MIQNNPDTKINDLFKSAMPAAAKDGIIQGSPTPVLPKKAPKQPAQQTAQQPPPPKKEPLIPVVLHVVFEIGKFYIKQEQRQCASVLLMNKDYWQAL